MAYDEYSRIGNLKPCKVIKTKEYEIISLDISLFKSSWSKVTCLELIPTSQKIGNLDEELSKDRQLHNT